MSLRARLLIVAVMCIASCCSGIALAAFKLTTAPVSPDGTAAVVDLPREQHIRNVGGSDGSGLCVFTSVQHAAAWQNITALDGFRAWMERRPGGGWPEKLDQMLAQFAREKGAALPSYIQHTGGDATFLELALHTDRFPCVTYDGRDDFYSGQIAHMVNLAHLDKSAAAIIDNNRPGNWVWMTRAEFLSRWRGNSGGWAVVLLADPPPSHPESPKAFGAACVCGDNCTCPPGACPTKCPVVFGQCPGGRCPLPSSATPISPAAQSGIYNLPTPPGEPPTVRHEWRQFDDGGWGWRFQIESPVVAAADNFGVTPGRIHSHPDYSISGYEVTREQARRALGAGSLTDDSDRWHLTAVGDMALLKSFSADVAALPADMRGKLLVQTYSPDHWAVVMFKLPAGVSLRRPSPVGPTADVGAVATADYSAAKLNALLALPDGPTWKPTPIPPMPIPVPPVLPIPAPVAPNQPDPLGPLLKPAPVAPLAPPVPAEPKSDHSGWVAAALVVILSVLKRKG